MTSPSEGTDDSRNWPVRNVTSFGGVVVRDGSDGLQVALIRPMSTDLRQVWALPKGGAESDEGAEDSALREVREETAIEAEVVSRIDPITYWFAWAPDKVRYRKTVHYFLMRYVSGEATPDGVEVAEVRFFSFQDALKQASYPSERTVIKAAIDLAAAW